MHHPSSSARPIILPKRSAEKGKDNVGMFSAGPGRVAAMMKLSSSPPTNPAARFSDELSLIKCGYLNKLSKGIIKSWKKRWFVLLDPPQLHVYLSQEAWASGANPRNRFDLIDCSITIEHRSKSHSFGIYHPDPKCRDLILQAHSEQEMIDWITTIETKCLGVGEEVSILDFELLALVGRGAFGKVIQIKKKDTGTIYALKVLNKKDILSSNQLAATETERRVLEVVNHPFIVRLHSVFQTKDKLCFVLDFINGGDIFNLIKNLGRLSEDHCRFYSAQIILALEYLHEMHIIYRDLKPENVLISADGFIKLTDFGLSKDAMSERTYTIVGSPYYIAPEIVLRKGHNKAVDWWSLGILCYEMLIGLPPFYSDNFHQSYKRLLEEPLEFPLHLRISNEAQQLVKGLLTVDPRARLGNGGLENDATAHDLRESPFFNGHVDWNLMFQKRVAAPYKPHVKDDRDVSHFDLAVCREELLLSKDHETQQFEDFDYSSPSNQASPLPAPDSQALQSKEGGATKHEKCPVMVAATEYLDECEWDYTRAVQGLIAAILNREEVQLALASEDNQQVTRDKLMKHPGVHQLRVAFQRGFEQFEDHLEEIANEPTHDWGKTPSR